MRPRPFVLSLLALVLLAATSRPALAWSTGDTLTVIWRPLPNLPALARPGDVFRVWANAPAGATGWSARLQFGALDILLTPAGGTWQPSRARWELDFFVPMGTPEQIYDLTLTSSITATDVSRHAVKVLPGYRTDYYFAQISDTHLPTHALSSGGSINTADTTGMADFDAVIEDLNTLHPEFILHTGDLVNEGELEEYLGMYEMGRAKDMLSRLCDPIFVVSGNHDQGGWRATLPPDGTAKKNWWRHFGWPNLENPPAGEPFHSQDFSFDYGPLHVIGLETYINNGSYDHYRTDLWGAQSFTSEQLGWLNADLAAAPPGSSKLAFYHYDFGGTTAGGGPGPNFSQINPAALGLAGAIWGHNHGVAEGNRTAQPFNLGLQSVIDRRAFRIFRVSNGVISPGPMHRSGGIAGTPVDSLAIAWDGPNDGSRSRLSATVTNRFGETWERARLVFTMVDHDSSYVATGGTVVQTVREGGRIGVYVDCVLPAGGTTVVTVAASLPLSTGAGPALPLGFELETPAPNPYVAGRGALALRFTVPTRTRVEVAIFDLEGRRVAELFRDLAGPGTQGVRWDGRTSEGRLAPASVYLARVKTATGERVRRFVMVR